MVLVQKWPFFQLFFFWKYRPGNVFYDILEGKTPFSAIKTSSLKERKIDISPKGLTHDFGPKMAIFPTFLFKPIKTRKMSLTIFQNGKSPFQTIKTRTSKSRNIDIFQKGITLGFGRKMAFFQLFFLCNIGRENVFYDILERKKSFLGYKNKKCKTSKNSHFSTGVNPCFGPTMAIFPTFFQAIQSRRMSFTIFQNKKTPYQPIKT